MDALGFEQLFGPGFPAGGVGAVILRLAPLLATAVG